MSQSVDQDIKTYVRGELFCQEFLLVELPPEVMEYFTRCMLYSEEGGNTTFVILLMANYSINSWHSYRKEWFNPDESIVPTPHPLLYSHGEGSTKDIVSGALKLRHGMIVSNMVGYIWRTIILMSEVWEFELGFHLKCSFSEGLTIFNLGVRFFIGPLAEGWGRLPVPVVLKALR